MTPREFSIDVIQQLTDAGYLAYWAGGCVRDLLLGKEPHDFDVATDADPQTVREIFGHQRSIPVGESFGVMIVLGPKSAGQVEVATFRSEGEYLDGRRPESVAFCTPEEDAQRRDFTINGMFYDPISETVHDFVQGQEDLRKRVVRAIGDPHDRMEEDKLRLLRAVRFTAALNFDLDPTTADAVRGMAHQLVVVSAERIAQELKKMLTHENRGLAMSLCEQLDLLPVFLPEVVEKTIEYSLERWQQRIEFLHQLPTNSFEVAMAALLRDVPAPQRHPRQKSESGTVRAVLKRLKLSNQEVETIEWLVRKRGIFDQFADFTLAEKKRLVVSERFDDLFIMERTAASVEKRSDASFEMVERFRNEVPVGKLAPPDLLNGRELIELGFRPGEQFKHLLGAVRDAQLNEQIETKEQAIELVRKLSKD
ncbi:CCA tRNA nucleotidyltransferase [Thalassoglobus polymorphus]|uniref:tRNA nucleotidyltransferase/poly(A) polymerase n=1 Tax=Thalassoglobus polymorphus TaxID=2527994 RepID=A0A517QHT3_9PLAN|nr:CCA tRNA nucleotidyltransferase [Thalassoglobus polymorphus]QDT31195.1 tRNA nucleotidyltransferase/poly(A) polymerase [Thalassoglobus polymorphus]